MHTFKLHVSFIILCFLCLNVNLQGQETIFSKADSLLAKNYNKAYLLELHKINNSLKQTKNQENHLTLYKKFLEYYRVSKYNKDSIQKYYTIGSQLSKKYENPRYKVLFSYMWADYHVSIGNYSKALSMFQSLEKEIKDNNYSFLPHFYDSYARLFYYLKEYEDAFALLKKEAKIFEARGHDINISGVYNNLGILYGAQKQKDSSLYYHNKAQKINEKLKDTINIIKSFNNIGKTYFTANDFINADKYYQKAYNFAPSKASVSLLNNYATLLFLQGNKNKAEQFLLKVKKESDNKELLKSTLSQLITLKKSNRNFEDALKYQEELNTVTKNLLDETKVKEIERLKIGFETAKKEKEILDLKEKNEAQQSLINKNKLIVTIIIVTFFLTIIVFVLYLQNKSNIAKINELKIKQSLLYSQMNPHFIFNALSNIQTNILKSENDKAIRYLSKFSKLLRYNVENTNLNKTLLSDEIQYITDYLDLQKLRLDNTLSYHIHIDEFIEENFTKIPAMMLQPIIENAIEHGVESVEDPRIDINIQYQENYLICCIKDNGIGYSNTLKNRSDLKKSFATRAIKERLAYLAKKTKLNTLSYTIKDIIENHNIVGTEVCVNLPIFEFDEN